MLGDMSSSPPSTGPQFHEFIADFIDRENRLSVVGFMGTTRNIARSIFRHHEMLAHGAAD